MNQIILHIPHSSTLIPDRTGFVIDDKQLNQEIDKLTDWFTDELFDSPKDLIVKANFSRLFCDPERFCDDAEEIMARYGMGVLYEKTDCGLLMRSVDANLRNEVLKNYYLPHHKKLTEAVKGQLATYEQALIVDCHSFSDTPFIRDLNQTPNRPDINIGTHEFHTSDELKDFSISYFEQRGMTVGIDWPYSGTIVPKEYYEKNKAVNSIMIEVNRKLYLQPNSTEKNEHFESIKLLLTNYINDLKEKCLTN